MNTKKIILICKDTEFCSYAINILDSAFNKNDIYILIPKNKSDIDKIKQFKNIQYIISFLSPYKIPMDLLNMAQRAAINFHPGSPNYPGIGCYNFALYEKSKEYGVTCHHMNEKFDAGEIIMTSYFKILGTDTVESLKLKSMIHLLYLFEKVVALIKCDEELPSSTEKWTRRAFTRKELEKLCEININKMDMEEIDLRVKATRFDSNPLFGPRITIGKHKFLLSNVEE